MINLKQTPTSKLVGVCSRYRVTSPTDRLRVWSIILHSRVRRTRDSTWSGSQEAMKMGKVSTLLITPVP